MKKWKMLRAVEKKLRMERESQIRFNAKPLSQSERFLNPVTDPDWDLVVSSKFRKQDLHILDWVHSGQN